MGKQVIRWKFWLIGWEFGKGPVATPQGQTSQHWPVPTFERKAAKLLERPEIRRDTTLVGEYYVGANGDALICCPPEMDPLTY